MPKQQLAKRLRDEDERDEAPPAKKPCLEDLQRDINGIHEKLDQLLEVLQTKKKTENLNDIALKLMSDPANLRAMYVLFLRHHTPTPDQKAALVDEFIKEAEYDDENGALSQRLKSAVNNYLTKKRDQWKESILTTWRNEEYEEISADRVRAVCRKAREKKHFRNDNEQPAIFQNELNKARELIERLVAGEIVPRSDRKNNSD